MKFSNKSIAVLALLAGTAFSTKEEQPPKSSLRSRSVDGTIEEVHANVTSVRDLRSIHSRIVGGQQAAQGQFDFYVQWYSGRFEGTCGASLVADNVILTAAHCALSSDNVWVGAWRDQDTIQQGGAPTNGQGIPRKIIERRPHPNYNGQTLEYDYEVMKLDAPVTSITPIALPASTSLNIPSDGSPLTVVGMGDTSSGGSDADFLRYVTVPTVPHSTCNDAYGGGINREVMLCAGDIANGGKDSCQQDSGGPIFEMVNGEPVQVGIVSWGIGCAQAGYPGVYSRTSFMMPWLKENICEMATPGNKPAICNDDGTGGGGGGGGGTPPPPPPPPAGCDSGLADLKVKIKTDNYGAETSFVVTEDDSGTTILSGSGFADNELRIFDACVDPSKCYTFQVDDSWGDGMCCAHGEGSFDVVWNGQVEASGGNFASSEIVKVGVCSTNPPPPPPPPPSDDTATLEITFQTDSWAGESTLVVRDLITDSRIFFKNDFQDNTPYSYEFDLDRDGCYLIRLKDSFGDGICCSEGQGYMEGYIDGTQIIDWAEFTTREQVRWPTDCTA